MYNKTLQLCWTDIYEPQLGCFELTIDVVSQVKRSPGGKYGPWRQGQKTIAARLANQLKASWELEELTEEELNKFCSHYNCAMVPAQLKDVALFFMPRWTPPHDLAALSWLGDWRPSAILELIHGLTHSSSSFLSDSSGIEQLISHVIHEIRIEETVIDDEMAEIQATCILHLPFSRLKKKQSGGSALGFIQEEFKKIERVIMKAQQLRFKALELVVKKVLSQTDAAAFFVAFTGIQDAIHQVAKLQKLEPVTVPTKTSREQKMLETLTKTKMGQKYKIDQNSRVE